ncbi:MAG: tRNA pseudouridine synthase B [Pyrinomonadaceae bacterium]
MDGALIIDKPAGMTSHDVVARVRRIIGERRVGHTGTLDPFATGVLVMLVGRATRLAQFLSGAEKEYEAVIRLGYATDTGDVTGARVDSPSPHAERGSGGEVGNAQPHPQSLPTRGEGSIPDVTEIAAAMALLTGEIEQVPPMYSAKKIAGRKLYEHARRGEEIERQPLRVTISEFELLTQGEWEPNDEGAVDLRARVVCSAGTYIRTLAEDLGKRLGIGAHLAELRRTRAGRFCLENSLTLEKLEEHVDNETVTDILITPNTALSHLPDLEVGKDDETRLLNGIDLPVEAATARLWADEQAIRLRNGDELLAVGFYERGRGVVHPQIVIKQRDAGVNLPS